MAGYQPNNNDLIRYITC